MSFFVLELLPLGKGSIAAIKPFLGWLLLRTFTSKSGPCSESLLNPIENVEAVQEKIALVQAF